MAEEQRKSPVVDPTASTRAMAEEVMCPSCGKFVGAYQKCPYCGTELKKRMSIRFFKRAAIVLAVGGLFLLWFTATKMNPPLIKISDINSRYNNAVVEVKGEVIRTKHNRDKGSVSFQVSDGTGEIRAQSFDAYKEMDRMGNLPQAGDIVSAVGSVQISDKYGTSLMVNVPSRVQIIPREPERIEIGEITVEERGAYVDIVGEIVDVWRTKKGHVILTLGDLTGRIKVPLWQRSLDRVEDEKHKEMITTEGNELRLTGSVDEYKGEPELQVRDINKIEVLKEDTIPTRKIPERGVAEAKIKEQRILEREKPGMRKVEEEEIEQPVTSY